METKIKRIFQLNNHFCCDYFIETVNFVLMKLSFIVKNKKNILNLDFILLKKMNGNRTYDIITSNKLFNVLGQVILCTKDRNSNFHSVQYAYILSYTPCDPLCQMFFFIF